MQGTAVEGAAVQEAAGGDAHPPAGGGAVGRRTVLGGLGLSPLLALVPRPAVVAAMGGGTAMRFFDEHQAAVVVEATARLVPGPLDDPAEAGYPGAREAGVVGFVDLLLSAFDDDPPRIFAGGPWSARAGAEVDAFAEFVALSDSQEQVWRERIGVLQATYRSGIAALDAAAGGDFTAVGATRRDEILVGLADFRRVLFEHAVEAMYAAPEYGGNRDLLGWEGIGYAGDVAPRGFTAAEVADSDGADPAPADVPLPYEPAAYHTGAAAPPGRRGPPAHEEPAEVIDDLGAFLAAALPGLGRRGWRRG